jgi:peptidoglycan hydrolase-like protein with peptidoglycan-binding domain
VTDTEAAPASAARRWVRLIVSAGAAVAVAGVVTVAALGLFGGDDEASPSAGTLPPATTEITRTTLVASEQFDGTLGYGKASVVLAPGTGTGLVTWLPEPGETIRRGEPVYAVNAQPVTLLYGSMPLFRQLVPGDTGQDVKLLERNLAELGYDGFTVDNEYTSGTAGAVAEWQADLGRPQTGPLDPARVVVSAGAIRVAEPLAPLGAPAAGEVLSYTGADRLITVPLDVADQQLVAEEMTVTVTLPDGSTVDGTVSEVGTVATAPEPEQAEAGQPPDQPTTVEVTITVDDPEALGDWDAAPVEVTLETDRREGVLAVPVEALVALAEGGYGLQVVDGESTSYVAVDTGLFAQGLVEIEGDGIAEGMRVGVPSS